MDLGLYKDYPDWRYATALSEVEHLRRGAKLPYRSEDGGVRYLTNFLSTWLYSGVDRRILRRQMYPMSALYEIYTDRAAGGLKDIMEACILARASLEFMKQHVHPDLTTPLVNIYMSMFFDVGDNISSAMWIERCVFQHSNEEREERKWTTGHLWKVVGYYGGVRQLVAVMTKDVIADIKELKWIKDYCKSGYARMALHSVQSGGRVIPEYAVPMVQQAMLRSSLSEEVAEAISVSTVGSTAHIDAVGKTLALCAKPDKVDDPIEIIAVPMKEERIAEKDKEESSNEPVQDS